MTYSEYINESKFIDNWKIEFPKFFECVEMRYFDFNILYTTETLDRLISGFLIENDNELTKYKNLEKQLFDVFLKENYGTTTNMDVLNLPDEVSETILSYDGINSDGEFNKTTSKHMGKSSNNTKQQSVNVLETFISLNQITLNSFYYDLLKKFGNKFLQLCYN